MVTFNKSAICDVCKKPMEISDARIEWGYEGSISKLRYLHICHNDCCNDWTNRDVVGGDMIFNQPYTSDPAVVYENLQELMEDYPEFKQDFSRISNMVFK